MACASAGRGMPIYTDFATLGRHFAMIATGFSGDQVCLMTRRCKFINEKGITESSLRMEWVVLCMRRKDKLAATRQQLNELINKQRQQPPAFKSIKY